MAKKHGMPAVHGSEVNVTPLIDVIMCLIIFFMLVAKIGVKSGADDSIKIPESYLGNKIEDMGNTVTLNVRPPVGSENNAIGADLPEVTVVNAQGALAEMPLSEMGPDGKPNGKKPLLLMLKALQANNKNYKVIIRGEANMRYRFLEPVLITCAEGGANNVNFNTKKTTQLAAAP